MKEPKGLRNQTPRDDFAEEAKATLAKRVSMLCSNPTCRVQTVGPRSLPTKSVNIGVAAHISAASSGGPRFDSAMTAEQRKSVENGIWLCQNCAKLIDNDASRFTASTLRLWKAQAELAAESRLGHRGELLASYRVLFEFAPFGKPTLHVSVVNDLTCPPKPDPGL